MFSPSAMHALPRCGSRPACREPDPGHLSMSDPVRSASNGAPLIRIRRVRRSGTGLRRVIASLLSGQSCFRWHACLDRSQRRHGAHPLRKGLPAPVRVLPRCRLRRRCHRSTNHSRSTRMTMERKSRCAETADDPKGIAAHNSVTWLTALPSRPAVAGHLAERCLWVACGS